MRVENAECTEKRSIVIRGSEPKNSHLEEDQIFVRKFDISIQSVASFNVDKNLFLSPPRGGLSKGGRRQGLVSLAEMPLEYLHFALKLASESLRTLWQEGEGGKEARENAGMPVAR